MSCKLYTTCNMRIYVNTIKNIKIITESLIIAYFVHSVNIRPKTCNYDDYNSD